MKSNRLIDTSLIRSRFQKHKSVRGKYLPSERFEDAIVEFFLDEDNFTVVSESRIYGKFSGGFSQVPFNHEDVAYCIIDEEGIEISDKKALGQAFGVRINNRCNFYVPSEAVLPFCNLLNFLDDRRP